MIDKTKEQLKKDMESFKHFQNYELIKEALGADDEEMQQLADKFSLRQIVYICKNAGLSMYHEKLEGALRAGVINYSKKIGRRPLTPEEELKRLDERIKKDLARKRELLTLIK